MARNCRKKDIYASRKFCVTVSTSIFVQESTYSREIFLYKNTIFSYEDVEFWQRIYIILYPSLKYSTTHITIIQKHENSYDDES